MGPGALVAFGRRRREDDGSGAHGTLARRCRCGGGGRGRLAAGLNEDDGQRGGGPGRQGLGVTDGARGRCWNLNWWRYPGEDKRER